MPLSIADLRAGDRVVLNCPKSKAMKKREAIFEGIFKTMEEAQAREGIDAVLIAPDALAFLEDDAAPFARFKFGEMAGADIVGAFKVEPDGALREQKGMRLTIERRVRMGQG